MKVLQKQKGKKFTVLNLSDPQLSNEEWHEGREEGKLLKDTLAYLIEQSKPDLITVSGDIAWAGALESYSRFSDLLDSYGIPWAPVFGNHDNQGGPEMVLKQAEIMQARKTCLMENGDPALGCGNYVIGIEEDGRLIHGIILMDSHDRQICVDEDGRENSHWAELLPAQFPWYREQIEMLQEKGVRESSIIMHIPLYTYRTAIQAALKEGVDPRSVSPYNGEQAGCWNPGYEDSFGVMYEGISSFPKDNGFFEEILAGGHTKTVLVGHDHVNNFGVRYEGVLLMFSMKIGSGCYWDPRINGGTVMTIDSDGRMEAEHLFYRPDQL